ncbi:fibronectin type III domain-containing protein [Thioalkalivibrio paradoxus]|uniref:Fibronectin type-III domain-containing protein n=1 Tax=Thioalkalivibrio paradoxus ARh 1 TaxID=713585 RepID=W0DML0_9GAMM|nr:fibronectin type III domain-containing protein [Thioalkalivibrio paradoxus]AHE98507.1 hypothetical protein THITH_09820 [Thioalkalivibrio paradoxus ARh 1]
MRTFARQVLVAMLLSLAFAASAAANGLFVPLEAAQADSAAALGSVPLAAHRVRDVAIDPAYLAQRIAPPDVDHVQGRLGLVPAPATVRLELFPGIVADLERTSISEAFGGGFVWTGEGRGPSAAWADLVIRDGRITGHVTVFGTEPRAYRIDPLPNEGLHRITELDSALFPAEAHPRGEGHDHGHDHEHGHDDHDHAHETKAEHLPQGSSAAENTTIVDVLITYTSAAAAMVSDIQAQANLAISLSNTAFTRSGVLVQYRLVGTHLVSGYTEPSSYSTLLHDLTNGILAPFQTVHTLRNSTGADLVALLVDNQQYCGIAWRPNMPSASTAQWGYSVTTIGCISNHTFAHELGHNFGLHHDRYVSDPAPNTAYNYGYVNLAGRFRTVMAYQNQCTDSGFSCTRINNFSNPAVLHEGRATGIPAGTTGAAHAQRWKNEVREIIAAYRPAAGPPNNLFANRINISVPGTVTGTNVGATSEPGQPTIATSNSNNAVWWRFTPANNCAATIDTFGSNFDTTLATFTGSAVNALTQVAANDDAGGGLQSRVEFQAMAGTEYQIAVAGYNNATGNITLNVDCPVQGPSVTTNPATSIGQDSATLNATVNPNGVESAYLFQYGTTTSYGTTIDGENIGAGTNTQNVSRTITELSCGTTYNFQAVAGNVNQQLAYGGNQTFTTLACATRIIRLTGGLSFGDVTVGQSSQRTLTIHNDGNSTLNVSSISYPSGFSGNWSGNIPAGSSRDVTVTFAPTAAQNYSGSLTVYSNRTSGTNTLTVSGVGVVPSQPPSAVTNAATNITMHSATLNASINPNGTPTIYWFDYGPTISYGSTTAAHSAGSGTSNVSGTDTVTGLQCGTTYHFRVRASNSDGFDSNGDDETFATDACDAPTTPSNLSAIDVEPTSARLVWEASTDNSGSGLAGYKIEYCTGAECSDFFEIGTAVGTDVTIEPLSPDRTYRLRVRAYDNDGNHSEYSNIVSFTTPLPEVTPVQLQNGVAVHELSGDQGSQQFFSIEIPADRTELRVEIWGGSGGIVDLYVRHGQVPTLDNWDCRPYLWGSEETCVATNPQAGTHYVMIHGYEAYTGLSLRATYTPAQGAVCGPDDDHTVTAGPQPGATKEVAGCRSIFVENGVIVPATGSLELVARERIVFRPGVRVIAGGQLSARVDSTYPSSASPALAEQGSVAVGAPGAESTRATRWWIPEADDARRREGVAATATEERAGAPISIGDGDPGSVEESDLTAPAGLDAIPGDGSVALRWETVPEADRYHVYWSRNPGIHPFTAASYEGFLGNVPDARAIVADLENDRDYFFVVTATRGGRESAASIEVGATPEAGPVLIAGRYALEALDAPTVVDLDTGLEWRRCALGQQWDGAACTGSAGSYSHAEAQQATAAFNRSRASEEPQWRLPEVGELQGLVYCTSGTPAHFPDGTGCWGSHGIPTLEPTVFPTGSAAGGWFWSRSTHTDGQAWGVDFNRGTAQPYQASAFSGVRLVRPASEGDNE